MGVDIERWRKKIGWFCNFFCRDKLHGYYKYTSCLSNSAIVPGIHLAFNWLFIITLLLLASGVEPYPSPRRPSVFSSDTDDAGLCTANCHVCKLAISDPEFLACFRCSKHTHVSCLVSSFKLQSGVPLKNSHNWLCDFLSFHYFLYVCKNCIGMSPSYNDVACSPVCVTSD